MRRLARHLFTLCSALSLLLCVAACVLWVRSYSGGHATSHLVGQHRYTLRSEQGRLSLMRPPRASDRLDQIVARYARARKEPPRRHGNVEALVRQISNDQIVWIGTRVVSGPERGHWREVVPFPGADGVAGLWPPHGLRPGEFVPSLLTALEQPDKFAVAHVLLDLNLDEIEPLTEPRREIQQQTADSVRFTSDGLTFEVRAIEEGSRDATHLADDEEVLDGASSVDVAQLPAIRDLWHRRLDVPLVAVPHWSLVAVLLVAPTGVGAASIYRRLRGRALAKAGRCRKCGYDLRASPGRCPECGTANPRAV